MKTETTWEIFKLENGLLVTPVTDGWYARKFQCYPTKEAAEAAYLKSDERDSVVILPITDKCK